MNTFCIDKDTATIERADMYLVNVKKKNGEILESLEPHRLFPYSDPNHYISLLDKDEKEICYIHDFDKLDDDSKETINACFKEFYLIPKIISVLDIYDRFGNLTWTVKTDRGVVKFRIRSVINDIKFQRNTGRIIIRDSNDNRYEIPNYDIMEAKSKKMISSYL